MTLKQAMTEARVALAADGIEDAALESELLLRYALKISRVQLPCPSIKRRQILILNTALSSELRGQSLLTGL